MGKKRKINHAEAGLIAVAVVVANLMVLVYGTKNTDFLMWSIAGIGAITFFGTLMLANFLSKSHELNKGEMRKAIAASVIVVYFSLIAFLTCEDCKVVDPELSKTIIGHFTYIVGIVIAFYFGVRAIEAWKKTTTTAGEPGEAGEPTGQGGEESETPKPK